MRQTINRSYVAPNVSSGGGGGVSTSKAKVSATDTTEGYLADKVKEDIGIHLETVNPAGNEALNVNSMHFYHDYFAQEHPVALASQSVRNSIWSIDTVNEYLENVGGTTITEYRGGIAGDFDYAFKQQNIGGSAGFFGLQFTGDGSSPLVAIYADSSSQLSANMTGQPAVTVTGLSLANPYWIRIARRGNNFTCYYKIDDTDSWVVITTFTKKDFQWHVYLKIAGGQVGNVIHEIIGSDASGASRLRSSGPLSQDLVDAPTIAVDVNLANVFRITLGGNRTLGNPVSGSSRRFFDGQTVIFKVRQDATGSRILSYGTDYRFSTDIPSPTLSTAANALDYLVFMYDETADKWDFTGKVLGF